jgi:glycosyltransferase involved in cell wall biosynthesis
MFESDKIPDDWIDYLQIADEIWVPSKWCQATFAKAGIKTTVVPLGYDQTVFTPIYRQEANKTRRDFTFLHYDAFNIRKGFVEVFKAFTSEFNKTEPVKLILKTRQTQSPLPITKSEYPNIECVYGKVDNSELHKLMEHSDVFLFPSRGEGFGMTPLEAMATGMPAIVPNAHGLTEYFNADCMYEVPVAEKCPALYARYKNQDVGDMVICDIPALRKKMRWCYEHQSEVITTGLKAQEYAKNWTFEKTAVIIKKRLDELFLKPMEPKRLANVLTLEQVK